MLLLGALAVGCVPKGRHELVEVQLLATRTALSDQSQQATRAEQAADEREAELVREIASRQAQLDELAARAEARKEAFEQLDDERVVLADDVARLRAEVEALRASAKKKPAPAPAEGPAVPDPVAEAQAHVGRDLAALEEERIAAARRDASQRAVEEAFAVLGAEGLVAVEREQDDVVVRIPTATLFQEGFTTLSPRGEAVIARVADALGQVSGRRVTVAGHTDDRPVHSAELASNWERGFSRAMAVLRALQGAGAPASLSAASFADTRPLVPPETPGAGKRNARVELVIAPDPALATRFAPTAPDSDPEGDAAPAPEGEPAPPEH
ncbi:MAG: OmpA family protein [Myxococcota bacterium]